MKNKTIIFNMFIFVTISIVLSSCDKEEEVLPQQQISIDKEFGEYTKEICIYDKNNKNDAILLIGSDDKAILDMWTSENFELIPIPKGTTTKKEISNYFSTNQPEEANIKNTEILDDDSDAVVASISYMILSKNLNESTEKILINTIDPYDDEMKGWRYSTEYSDIYANPGGPITCNIYGVNIVYRGYWALWYKGYVGASWSTIQPEWKQIKYGDSESENRSSIHQMKARRKYKGRTNPSVIIEFEY